MGRMPLGSRWRPLPAADGLCLAGAGAGEPLDSPLLLLDERFGAGPGPPPESSPPIPPGPPWAGFTGLTAATSRTGWLIADAGAVVAPRTGPAVAAIDANAVPLTHKAVAAEQATATRTLRDRTECRTIRNSPNDTNRQGRRFPERQTDIWAYVTQHDCVTNANKKIYSTVLNRQIAVDRRRAAERHGAGRRCVEIPRPARKKSKSTVPRLTPQRTARDDRRCRGSRMAIWTVMSALAASALDVPSLVLARPHLHLRWIVPISRWTLLSGVVLLVVSLLSWRQVASALGWRRKPTLLTLLALTMALSLTLSPRDWLRNHKSLHQCLPSDWADLGESMLHVGGSLESVLNIILLMPLGYGLVVASRRAVWPAALMMTLPAGIELLQVIVPGRQCSPSDWAANALGGLIGVAAGALVNRRLRRSRQAREAQRETMAEA